MVFFLYIIYLKLIRSVINGIGELVKRILKRERLI